MADKSEKKKPSIIERIKKARYQLLIYLAATIIIFIMLLLTISPVKYDLSVGMVPPVTIAASKDIVDEVTTQARREEAARQVIPIYTYQENITENVLYNLDQVFSQLRAVRQYGDTLPDVDKNRVFTSDELSYAKTILTTVSLSNYQLTTLLRTPSDSLDALYTSMRSATENTMNGHVAQGDESEAVRTILYIIGYGVDRDLLQNIGLPVLNYCIQPNMVIDQEATSEAQEAARQSVEPVIYKQGQNIIVKSEGVITLSQIEVLHSLGLLNDQSDDPLMWLGSAILSLAVLISTFVLTSRLEIRDNFSVTKTLLTCIILVLSFGLCIIGRMINSYCIPSLLCVMLATALVSPTTGCLCNTAIAVLVTVMAAGSSEAYTEQCVYLMICTLLTGSLLAAVLHHFRSSRLTGLVAGILAAVFEMVLFLAIGLLTTNDITAVIDHGLWRAAGTIASALLFTGIQPLLELVFNLPTPYKLLLLSNPSQPLLNRLMLEAPGTYHHSIIVSNLAEASARAINANSLLCRVAGYYHDIGKLKRPLYFKENQIGDDHPLDLLDPLTAATIVTSHVSDGVALAREARLPKAVIQMIQEHHGDTPVQFFYAKAVKEANGKPVNIDDFRYHGSPPRTREGAILMLCDTIEAAVRTLHSPTPEEIELFIVKLVRGKIEDGQLSLSPLTLLDLDKICIACTTVLKGAFHERIEYPDAPKREIRVPTAVQQESRNDEEFITNITQSVPDTEVKLEEIALPQITVDPLTVIDPDSADEVEIPAAKTVPSQEGKDGTGNEQA